uniref:Uncharacterized protein n=1 Tax=Glossina austeni TaxID=7395 RepID=A0A1A9VSU5_GLOAU
MANLTLESLDMPLAWTGPYLIDCVPNSLKTTYNHDDHNNNDDDDDGDGDGDVYVRWWARICMNCVRE